MICPEVEAHILRLHHAEKWPIGTIARQLGVHHSVVRRVLGAARGSLSPRRERTSLIDPYRPFIIQTLEKWPGLHASRLYGMVRERGYRGGPDHFRALIAQMRPRRHAEAYLRLRTLPAEQAQVDWAHFGKIRVGNAERALMGFVMVLSYSRMIFLQFYLNAQMESFVRGHLDAFAFFGGVPRVILYDNLKSAVLERVADTIRFNPRVVELAAYHRYEPRPVAVARGNEKGRVERAIRYIRGAFFAARSFTDLVDLNAQAIRFCLLQAADRLWPQDPSSGTVADAYENERALLLPLPENPFPSEERIVVSIGKTPYARFDGNDYSVPHTLVRRQLTLLAGLETLRIVDGSEVVAEHPRCWEKGRQIESRAHIEQLEQFKRGAKLHRGQDRLAQAAPSAQILLQRAAENRENLSRIVRALLQMLDSYGADELEQSITNVLAHGLTHPGAVRQELERARYERNQSPAVQLPLDYHPKLREIVIRTPSLQAYDALHAPNPPVKSDE